MGQGERADGGGGTSREGTLCEMLVVKRAC